MSRGMLDDSDWEQYVQEFPDLSKLEKLVPGLSPDFLSIPCSYGSHFPIASVCFKDAYEALWGAQYALFEAIAHNIWYLRKKDPPNEAAAASFGRFYADDAALRLYSAAEHLANGTIMMFEIGDEELEPYRRKEKRISQQSIVGHYLRQEKTSHPVTIAIIKLADSKEWQATMTYRNRWVHEQPPTVEGLGIVYERRIRWEPSPTGKGYILRGGRGDKPEYSVDELVKFIKPAMFRFINTFTSVVEFYIQTWNDLASVKFKRPEG